VSPRLLLRIVLLAPIACLFGICMARLSRLAYGSEDLSHRAIALNVLAARVGMWCLGLYDRLADDADRGEAEPRPPPPSGKGPP
jgi:hypothetical protein